MSHIDPKTLKNALAVTQRVAHESRRGKELPVSDHEAIVAMAILVEATYNNVAELKRLLLDKGSVPLP